jgi:uncharacterized membrane protein
MKKKIILLAYIIITLLATWQFFEGRKATSRNFKEIANIPHIVFENRGILVDDDEEMAIDDRTTFIPVIWVLISLGCGVYIFEKPEK